MEIRLARGEDIPGILELLRQVGRVHYELRPDIFREDCQKYDENALLELLKEENRPIYVAVEGGFVAGYCFCVLKDLRNGHFADRLELYIDDLCVDERCRGTGIARALYAYVTDRARELGCGFITLNVWSGNQGAEKFYEKAGLTPRSVMMEMKLC